MNDQSYSARREAAELEAAEKAVEPNAKHAHLELARMHRAERAKLVDFGRAAARRQMRSAVDRS